MMFKQAFAKLLEEIGEDPKRSGLEKTHERLVEMYRDFFTGYQKDPQTLLSPLFPLDRSKTSQMITILDIPFFSLCEHHFVPFFGKAQLSYFPSDQIFGLGRIHRFISIMSRKLALQEKLCHELALSLYNLAQPRALLLSLQGTHTCSAFSQHSSKPVSFSTHSLLGDESLYPLLNQELSRVS